MCAFWLQLHGGTAAAAPSGSPCARSLRCALHTIKSAADRRHNRRRRFGWIWAAILGDRCGRKRRRRCKRGAQLGAKKRSQQFGHSFDLRRRRTCPGNCRSLLRKIRIQRGQRMSLDLSARPPTQSVGSRCTLECMASRTSSLETSAPPGIHSMHPRRFNRFAHNRR